ncbi:putative Noranthrone monooxygenase [Seiridium cardinale]
MGSILSDLDPTKLPLTGGILGILSTHLFYSMNTTINYLTIPTVFLGQPPKDHSQPASPAFLVASTGTAASPASHLNRQWQEIYWRGHRSKVAQWMAVRTWRRNSADGLTVHAHRDGADER